LDVHGELESQPTLTVKPNPSKYMGTEIPACHYIMIPLQSLSRKTDGNFRLAGRDHSSSSLEETTATPARPVLRLAQVSAIPEFGSWRSCPVPKHTAEQHPPNACPSWQSLCHRSPARNRCRQPAGPLEPAVPSP